MAVPPAHAQSGPSLYVPILGTNNVSIIDTSTNLVAPGTISVGNTPVAASVTGDQSFVYVTNSGDNTVTPINTATNAAGTPISVGTNPHGAVITPNGQTVYVANYDGNSVTPIDTVTNTAGTAISVGTNPNGIAITPDGKTLYVANQGSNTVTPIDTATNVAGTPITVGSGPIGVAVSPDGKTVFVANSNGNTVTPIDTATNTAGAPVTVGSQPSFLVFTPDGKTVYVVNEGAGTVTPIDTATNTPGTPIAVGGVAVGIAATPDGKTVYVTSQITDTVTPIDTATNVAGTAIPIAAFPALPTLPGICTNGNALLATGSTFKANTSGALACTGSSGPVFTGGTMQFTGAGVTSALPIKLSAPGGTFDTVGNNATLSGVISGPGSLAKTGTGKLTLSGVNTYAGGTVISAGVLQVTNSTPGTSSSVGTGTVTLDGGTFQAGANNLVFSNGFAINTTGGTLDTQANTLTLSGVIQNGNGTTGVLTKTGTGTLILNGTNTYSGGTNLSVGTIQIGNDSALGSDTLTMAAGTTLAFDNHDHTLNNHIVITGDPTFNVGSGTTQKITGVISDATTPAPLGIVEKQGAGTLILDAADTYSGGTVISAGTLQVTHGSSGGTSSVGTGIVTLDGGTFQAGANNLEFTNGFAINTTGGTVDTQANSLIISGKIQDGNGTTGVLTKTGTGTLELSGNNSYSGGTAINGGTLVVFTDNNLGKSSGGLSFDGGTLWFLTAFNSSRSVTLNAGGGTLFDQVGVTLSGKITGTGGLTKLGFAGTTLSGINDYTGGTTITEGGIAVTNNSSVGSGKVTLDGGLFIAGADGLNFTNAFAINAAGGQIATNGFTLTLSGLIADGTGAGVLHTTGTGTLILDHSNSYSGGTSVDQFGTLQLTKNDAAGSGLITLNGGTLRAGADNLNVSNAISISAAGGIFDTNGFQFTISSNILDGIGNGSLGKAGAGTLILKGVNGYSGGTSIAAGTLQATNDKALGTGNVFLTGGTFQAGANNLSIANHFYVDATFGDGIIDTNGYTLTLTGGISELLGGSGLSKIGQGTLVLSGSSNVSGTTTVAAGTLLAGGSNVLPHGMLVVNAAATLDLAGFSQANLNVTLNGGTIQNGAASGFLNSAGGTIKDISGTVVVAPFSGTTTLVGNNTYTGATYIRAFNSPSAVLVGSAANVFSAASIADIAGGGTLDLGGFTQTINTVFLDGGTIRNGSLTGALTSTGGTIDGLGGSASVTAFDSVTRVIGTNTYTGATVVNGGGMLLVDGSIVNSPLTTVNSGAVLTGAGSVGTTQVNAGGIFAPGSGIPGNGTPGSSMTVNGSLSFQSAAQYLIFLNPSTSSFANVTGTATLGNATVEAIFTNGTYIAKRYTIVTAGSVSGTFDPAIVNVNLPTDFKADLSYDPTHAYLDLSLIFVPPPGQGLSGNQQAVGNAIIKFFNSNGSIPLVWGGLTAAGLTQLSGESATASQQTTFDAMSQFMGLLTDPFIAGRGDPISTGSSPTAYAEQPLAYAAKRQTDAFAMFTKAPPQTFAQRWSVWAAGFGGSQTTDGNATLGSNNTRSSIYGTAVGADYRLSPNTIAGFALAGGGTNFSVNNLGYGRSDLFQAGAFMRHNMGAAYVTGALAYGWQDITTDRIVTVAGLDHLRAEFNASAWSGRVEGGYRFATRFAGITPYAAGQFVTFDLPNYMEQAISGANTFALGYSARSVTDSRSELGIRTDKSFATQSGIFTLRGRLAWAHDFDPDRNLLATFQTLPGASFVVNGATHAADSALTTVSAEWKWINGWSAAVTFEGEFSNVTSSYAGKGVVRYVW